MKRAITAAIVSLLISTWSLPNNVVFPALQAQIASKQTEATRKKAEAGDAQAQYELAEYLWGRGGADDFTEAVQWYRKAAEQGHVTAQCTLGLLYQEGQGVPQDYTEAARWFRKAAERGDVTAQCALAFLCENGKGLPQDYTEAARWYGKAAEQGVATAQCALASLYEDGNGLPQDYTEAARWYRKAAEQRDANAQCALGLLNRDGKGVPQDHIEAALWFRKAAEQGHAIAKYGLGLQYENGKGVPQDYVQAYRWYNEAAAQGMPRADRQRDSLSSRMTRDQIAEAQRLSSNFVPRKQGEIPPADASPKSSGTGFFITPDGYLITCHHVVDGASRLTVVGPAGTKDARLVRSDAANDIALLKVDGNFAALAVQPSRGVRMGDSVATVGFPNPGLQGFLPKFSRGEISALSGVQDDPRLFQISVPLQPGNSGGALADSSGNVVGVIMAKLGLKAAVATSGAIPENVNYALKSSFLLSFLESVPDLVGRLRPPGTAPKPTQQVAAELEKAAALVFAY
jgi:hypothetical protein